MISQEQIIRSIESVVDTVGVADVLLALARMCNEKAEHVRRSWQDEELARTWDRAARAIDRFSTHAAITTLPGAQS